MNIIIVEDEVMIFRRLQRMLKDILGEECGTIVPATNIKQAASAAENLSNVLVLLDLNLSGEDGFDLVRRAVAEPFQTIVVSANTDRAIEAYDLGVIDFVAKPFTQARLVQSLQKARQVQQGNPAQHLAVMKNGLLELVDLDSIVAIHGDGDYAKIETLGGDQHLHNKTLTQLEQQLPNDFIRVHRSHIVNMNQVLRIRRTDGGGKQLQCESGCLVPIGRSYLRAVQSRLII